MDVILKNHERHTYNSDDEWIVSITKTGVLSEIVTTGENVLPYAVRLSAQHEHVHGRAVARRSAPQYDAAQIAHKRRKERTSLLMWGGEVRLDLTRVATLHGGAGGAERAEYSYECEIEYVCSRALPPTVEGMRAIECILVDAMRAVCATLSAAPPPLVLVRVQSAGVVAAAQNHDARLLSAPFLAIDHANGPAVVAAIAALYAAAAPSPRYYRAVQNARGFVAPLPVALRRSHLDRLDARRFLVGDKSHGVRVLLYGTRSKDGKRFDVFLVNRENVVYRVLDAYPLGALRLPTILLDGELVEHKRSRDGRLAYIAFDVVSDTPAIVHPLASTSKTVQARHLSYYERLERIAHTIVAPLREALSSGEYSQMPFDIYGKQFWPLTQIDGLLEHMRIDDASRDGTGRYADERRCHAIDGVILVPNEIGVRPFGCTRVFADDGSGAIEHDGMFKLKFAGGHTADFAVRHDPTRLCCETPRGEIDFLLLGTASARFAADDEAALRRAPAGAIVECGYDASSGTWRLFGTRSKSEPNSLAIVLDAMMACAEHISLAELRTFATRPAPLLVN